MFGGAAGGGKSESLLQGAAQYVEVPNYAALLLRRAYTDLTLPGALMDRAEQWWGASEARWADRDKTWTFPSGSTITFGYMEKERDKYRYKSSEFQYIAFDELTQFSESQYRYMFSRLRRLKGSRIPIRMRSGTNPGDVGHEWVRARFIDGDKTFIPALLDDNPYLDREEYEASLMELDPITRAQLLSGDWTVRPSGGIFKREWFRIIHIAPKDLERVRYWDMAATEPSTGKDPDWTVGVLLGRNSEGIYYIIDVKRMRGTPQAVERFVAQTAIIDGPEVVVRMEQEPGASGKHSVDYYRRQVLTGFDFRATRSSGSKLVRAGPVSSQAEAGNVIIVAGPWMGAFLDELEIFDMGSHDDQVDALSGAFGHFNAKIRAIPARAVSVGRRR